jgi:hypothetical protein
MFAVSGIGAFLLRFDLSVPTRETAHLAYALAVWIVVKSIAFRMARLDRGGWGFVSGASLRPVGKHSKWCRSQTISHELTIG